MLSLQLPFAVFPLVLFTGDKRKMGALVAPRWMLALAWPVAVLIAGLNAWLLWQTFASEIRFCWVLQGSTGFYEVRSGSTGSAGSRFYGFCEFDEPCRT